MTDRNNLRLDLRRNQPLRCGILAFSSIHKIAPRYCKTQTSLHHAMKFRARFATANPFQLLRKHVAHVMHNIVSEMSSDNILG